jgi:para-aminobenzoate synthetase component 1
METVALDRFLSAAGQLTGVRMEPMQWEGDFVDLAARFAHLPGTVLLLSGGDHHCSQYHLLGIMPWLTIEGRDQTTQLTLEDDTTVVHQAPLHVVRVLLEQFRTTDRHWPVPLAAGLMGYLAYDLKDRLETLPKTSVDDTHLPDLLLYAPSIIIVHNKSDGGTHLLAPHRSSNRHDVDACIARFHDIASRPAVKPMDFGADADAARSNFTQSEYQDAVRRIIDYIAAGDVYQVNLSQRYRIPFKGSGFGLFRHLYQENPAPFFAYIQAGDHEVVSTSPERFLRRVGQQVETRPIKGTRPRGKTEKEDRAGRDQLIASAKDDAELSMIVDLLRNDIGKVCAAGTVKVTEHKRLEAYQNVYHLVSVVEGVLDAGKDSVDLIKAAFPGGSITGCPKVRAMEIIDELESCRRHVYCGSIGYLSFHDTMDLSIAIRTATILNGTMSFSVGGGIVFDSDPLLEYEETLHKGRTLTAACQAGRSQRPVPMVWHNGHIKPAPSATVPADDQGLLYGYGFFETLRADGGRVTLLADHIERFEKSWKTLMPSPVPDLTWSHIIDRVTAANALNHRCAAVKILATRGRRSSTPWDHTLLVSARPYRHRLETTGHAGLRLGSYPHPRQTPLAGHKSLNYLYYLQAGRWAREHGFDEAVIFNPDGTVSETNTANLLLIHNNKKVVRPQSTAALPGVMARAVVRQLALSGYDITTRPVRPGELASGRLLLATNALMGAVAVTHVDGRPRPADDDLWVRLNDAIIPKWRV